MHGRSLIAVLVASASVYAFVASDVEPAGAQDGATGLDTPNTAQGLEGAGEQLADPGTPNSTSEPSAGPAALGAVGEPSPKPVAEDRPADADEAESSVPAHPIVAEINAKLSDTSRHTGAAAEDVAALKSFYDARSDPPLWITTMGFSSRAQAVINEIAKAEDWGLSSAAFELPSATQLPATPEAQAMAEIKLDLAVLQYARFAGGGRLTPTKLSVLIDQKPRLRDAKTVLSEIEAAVAPDAYLRSLHPKHEQFERLRQALLKARATNEAEGKQARNERQIQRLIINMERWRWLPEDLGSFYVWNNSPEFITRVVKDGKAIYTEKTIVGQLVYATPIFSAEMKSIVFHPAWVVPETIIKEDLQPPLRQGGFFGLPDTTILRQHNLSVSLNGQPVNPFTVDWRSENIHKYTFTQAPGPKNVLGALKFNFPNRHAIYMHDTPEPELFAERVRTLSHGCIRVKDPNRLAALLLAEDKGWSQGKVDRMIASNQTNAVELNRSIPVYLTYFTAVVDAKGKVETFGDIYGLDGRIGSAIFGKRIAFEGLAENVKPEQPRSSARNAGLRRVGGGLANSIQGLFGN